MFYWKQDSGRNTDGEYINDLCLVDEIGGRVLFTVEIPKFGDVYIVSPHFADCHCGEALWFFGEDSAKLYCESEAPIALSRERRRIEIADHRLHRPGFWKRLIGRY
jgi:hypothetical protein